MAPPSPAGLIAIDKRGAKVLFLDPIDLATTDVLDDFAPVPHELLILAKQRRAWIPIYGTGTHANNPEPGNQVAIVDLDRRRHVGDIDLGALRAPHGIAEGADGLVYVTCEASGAVAVLDPARDRLVATIETGSFNAHRLALHPDGVRLYTDNEEDATVSILDIGVRRLVGQIEMPRPIAGVTVSPDGTQVLAVDDTRPVLFVIEAGNPKRIREIQLEEHEKPAQIARYSPDGKLLLVTSSRGGAATLFDAGLRRQSLIVTDRGSMDAAFHPDGRTLLVANQFGGTISVIDLDTMARLRNVPAGVGCEALGYF